MKKGRSLFHILLAGDDAFRPAKEQVNELSAFNVVFRAVGLPVAADLEDARLVAFELRGELGFRAWVGVASCLVVSRVGECRLTGLPRNASTCERP